MNKLNCPNCAAPITSDTCQYCGAVFLDFSAIQLNKPSYIKIINDENDIMLMKLIIDEFSININSDIIDAIGRNNTILSTINNYSLEVNMNAHAITMNNGTLMTLIKEGSK